MFNRRLCALTRLAAQQHRYFLAEKQGDKNVLGYTLGFFFRVTVTVYVLLLYLGARTLMGCEHKTHLVRLCPLRPQFFCKTR